MDSKLLELAHRWDGMRRDREELKQLVAEGLDVNEAGPDGQTALHWVARTRLDKPYADDFARALVEAGADTNAADVHGNLPLHYACANGADDTLVFNALGIRANVNAANNAGERPLHWAQCAKKDHRAWIIQHLLRNGARVNSLDARRRNALHWALSVGNTGGALRLMAAGANVNAIDKQGRTPLYWVARQAQQRFAREHYRNSRPNPYLEAEGKKRHDLFDSEAEIAHTDIEEIPCQLGLGDSALLLLPKLLKRGADPKRADEAAKALLNDGASIAAFCQDVTGSSDALYLHEVLNAWQPGKTDDSADVELLENLLVRHKAENGGTLPGWACKGETAALLAEVLAATRMADQLWLREQVRGGLDLSETEALHAAAARNRFRTVHWLIGKAPELVHARKNDGETPLHAAAFAAGTRSALMLIAAGAEVDARDRWGQTPLHVAAPYYDRDKNYEYDFTWTAKDTAFCRALLDAGADPHALDERGEPTCLVQYAVNIDPGPFAPVNPLSGAQPPGEQEPSYDPDAYGARELKGLATLKEAPAPEAGM